MPRVSDLLLTRGPRPFDPAGPFVARKPLTLSGVSYAPGESVPASAATPRRMRQLFDARWVEHAPEDVGFPDLPSTQTPASRGRSGRRQSNAGASAGAQ